MGTHISLDMCSWHELAGTRLRYAALATLVTAGRPLSISELLASFDRRGLRVIAVSPCKALADALGHEVDLGRAVRVRRSVYAAGRIAPSTRRRMMALYGPDGSPAVPLPC